MKETKQYETIILARQPVFDADLEPWAHQLAYHMDATAESLDAVDQFDATFDLVANLFLCPDSNLKDSRVMIHFPEESILVHAYQALYPFTTVVKVLEAAPDDVYYLQALEDLKAGGFQLAVADFQARPDQERLCALADYLAIDAHAFDTPGELEMIVGRAMRYRVPVLAENVDDHETYELLKEQGCSYFHGNFFKKPKILTGRKISSTQAARIRLFEAIEADDPDFNALAEIIESDVSLSYRLLTFLNSASFSFSKEITSIRQAVILVGWNQLRNWLRLLLLTDLAEIGNPRELLYLSAQRARFLETVGIRGKVPEKADSLFLLGLFSFLAPLLDMPMREILEHLPLNATIKQTLAREDTELLPWLNLVECMENMETDRIQHLSARLHLDHCDLEVAYQDSIASANAFFNCQA